jgi:hypothetical protein
MKCRWIFALVLAASILPLPVLAQSGAAPSGCPLAFLKFTPAGDFSGLSIRVKNVSGKKISGITFNAALADATEHWKWLHWNLDDTKPLRDFGWNKEINPDASKTLSWDRSSLDFEHGGGGAFVLISVLFSDGSIWEDPPSRDTCTQLWFNNHKKGFSKPVVLPFRQ